jgi:[1-hydroxy-2-(trimethylamino)ethyl]phosphonate dioxygenase
MTKIRKTKMSRVDDLFLLLDNRGQGRYGLSDVSQLEHALQSAALAAEAGREGTLVLAALFHDIGHLVPEADVALADRGIDDRHETVGAGLLEDVFGPAVADPVRLHVRAKRFLCARESDYTMKLSEDSRRSLALQGGAMTAEEAAAFEAAPGAAAAVVLRRLDDRAKVPGCRVPSLVAYRDLAFGLRLGA